MNHIFFYLLIILFHQIIHYVSQGILLMIYLKKHLFYHKCKQKSKQWMKELRMKNLNGT